MPLSRDSDLDGHLSPVLCGLQHPSEAEELQQIADRAHQSPLSADILFPAHAEATKTAALLDLSEDRLHDRLAHFVVCAPGFGLQLMLHLFSCRCACRGITTGYFHRIAMFVATCGNVCCGNFSLRELQS